MRLHEDLGSSVLQWVLQALLDKQQTVDRSPITSQEQAITKFTFGTLVRKTGL
jgi:hypothetical protein